MKNGLSSFLWKPEGLAHLTHKSQILSRSLTNKAETTEEEFTHVQEFPLILNLGSEYDFTL